MTTKIANPFVNRIPGKVFLFSITLFLWSFFLNSCDVTVEYQNLFDPSVSIAPPSKLKIDSVSETSVALSWTNNLAVSGTGKLSPYRTVIEYAFRTDSTNAPVFEPIDTVFGATSSVTFIRLFEQAAFHAFVVHSSLGSKAIGYSNIVSTGMYTQPLAPSNIGLSLINVNDCHILWQDNSSSELYFQMERKAGANGTYTMIAQLPANTTRFEDTSVIGFAADTLYYRIRAVLPNGFYTPYATSWIYYPLDPPNPLTAQNANRVSIHLTWNDIQRVASGFVVERTERDGAFAEIARVPVYVTDYTDSPPDTAKEYSYRVRVFTGKKMSDPSNAVLVGFWPALVNGRAISSVGCRAIAVSPDYSLVALAGDNNGNISVLNASGYQSLRQFQNDGLIVNAVDIDRTDQYLAAGFTDNARNTGKIMMWRLSDGSLFREWERPEPVYATQFSPDGVLLAADGDSASIRILDFRNDTTIRRFPGTAPIAFSSDQSLIADRDPRYSEIADVWGMSGVGLITAFTCTGCDLAHQAITGVKFFTNSTQFVVMGTGWCIFLGNRFAVTVPQTQMMPGNVFCAITPDNKYLAGSSFGGIFVYLMGERIVTDAHLLVWATSGAPMSNGRILFGGSNGVTEYSLQNRWTIPVAVAN